MDHGHTNETESMAQVLFTNLLLLGLDVDDMEGVYKIQFNKDMFKGFNKPGANAILHFLFHNLNATICDEQFRDCWPIVDKKSEAQFRRACFNWLVTIKKADTDVRWPIISASSLQFPGGPKFIHILFRLTAHVLRQNIPDQDQEYCLVHPLLSATPSGMAAVKLASVNDNANLEMQKFTNQMYITNSSHQMWNKYASELVHGTREMSKVQREMEQEKRQVVTALAENAIKQGCTLPVKRTLNMFDGDKDSARVNRQHRIQRGNASWGKVNSFYKGLEDTRKIVKAVLDHTNSSERLDANDIGIRIPGLLLKQCEKEIRQQQIDNVYIGGRLNLLSLLQLWNLCLHLYLEQLEEEGLPDVTKEVPALTMQAHKFHSFLKEIQALREEISSVFVPQLEESIQNLRKELKRRGETEDTSRLSKSSLQLLTPTYPSSSLHKIDSDVISPVGLLTPKTATKKDTPTVLSEMMTSIATVSHKTQAVQPSRLVFDHFETSQSQRSSPSISTSKNSKRTNTNTAKIKRETVLKLPSKQASERIVKGVNQESRLSESKTSDKSLIGEKDSPTGFLDQMVHSVVDSVIDRHNTDDFWDVGHRLSNDVSLPMEQRNTSSFSKALMLELDQDSSAEVNAMLEDSFSPLKHGILLDKSPTKTESKSAIEALDFSLNLHESSTDKSFRTKGSNISADSSWNTNTNPPSLSTSPTYLRSPISSLETFDANPVSALTSPPSLPKSLATSSGSSFSAITTSMTKSPFSVTPIESESFRKHHRSEVKTNPSHAAPSSAWDIQKQVDDLFFQTCRIFEDIDD